MGIYRGWNGSYWDPDSRTLYGGVIDIRSSIVDYGSRRNGLRVEINLNSIGVNPTHSRGFVALSGNTSNTYTGLTEVIGGNLLILNKLNGATAIQGDIYARRGGAVALWRSNQIKDTATVTLDGREGMAGFSFDMMNYEMTEKFHQLVVKGEGCMLFHNRPDYRYLFLDDLLIERGGVLHVEVWADGITFLLVRKDSKNLQEALGRIKFGGYRDPVAGVVDYNKDYWKIIPSWTVPKLPEPTTYGAIVSAVAVGFVAVRRRKPKPRTPKTK